MTAIRVALAEKDHLGEGPFWDTRTGELLRVDISAGLLHGWSPASVHRWQRRLGGELSAVLPRACGDGWIAAAGHDLLLATNDTTSILLTVERELAENRFNDCKCDPQGRLWAGTMSKVRNPGTAALYRLSPAAELVRVLDGTTISNGIGWSPGGEEMYFIDSTTQRIDAFDFDGTTGDVFNRRPFASIDPSDGLPDGLTVDAEGGVWVCLFGGGALRRYSSLGALEAHIRLPVTNPTSPVFGGADLRTLYVTSARHRLSEAQLANEPLAGAVLAFEPGVQGLAGNRFAG